MKIKKVIINLLILASCYQFEAIANDLIGESLGVETTNSLSGPTDLFLITCPSNESGVPAYLTVSLKDETKSKLNAGIMSLQIEKDFQAVSVTDPTGGDSAYSKSIQLWPVDRTIAKGTGDYFVSVDKGTSPARIYSLSYWCVTEAGIHTSGATILTLQNN